MIELESNAGRSHPIKVLLVDDHPLIRQALRIVIQKEPDLLVVGEANDGQEAIKLAEEFVPDVVIMDITMPILNGLEATRRIKAKHPKIAVLVLTIHGDNEHVLGILEAGAAGYLTKSVFGPEVVQSIRGVVAGETVLEENIARQVLKRALSLNTNSLSNDKLAGLSKREYQILSLAALGFSNKDIALKLDLAITTVKSYFASIFSKWDVGSRTEAVFLGLRSGLISLDNHLK